MDTPIGDAVGPPAEALDNLLYRFGAAKVVVVAVVVMVGSVAGLWVADTVEGMAWLGLSGFVLLAGLLLLGRSLLRIAYQRQGLINPDGTPAPSTLQ